MKGYVGWALLALSLVCAYQGWQTRQGVEASIGPARAVVCDPAHRGCVLAQRGPAAVDADFMARRFQFDTSEGPVTVTCKRQYVFVGNFACTPAPGSLRGKS